MKARNIKFKTGKIVEQFEKLRAFKVYVEETSAHNFFVAFSVLFIGTAS